MRGIYKFTNKINNKSYIGQSINLEGRYASHRRNYKNPNLAIYNTHFYQALRKYGFENFDYTVLEENDNFTLEDLNRLEIDYIAKFDSFYNGYNMNPGGGNTGSGYLLAPDTILAIKQDLKEALNLSFAGIQRKYNIASTGLMSAINSGKAYALLGEYTYPIRAKEDIMKVYQGERNGRAVFTDEEVMQMRLLYQTEDLNYIYEKYKDRASFSAIKKIVYGVNHLHLPIYKKKINKWYLNGTCIDYPREEEQSNQ